MSSGRGRHLARANDGFNPCGNRKQTRVFAKGRKQTDAERNARFTKPDRDGKHRRACLAVIFAAAPMGTSSASALCAERAASIPPLRVSATSRARSAR
jgi:hypothetical protein